MSVSLDTDATRTGPSLDPDWARWGRTWGYTAAGLLVLAAILYGLNAFGVTSDPEPVYSDDRPIAELLELYFEWERTNATQVRLITVVAALGFLALVPLAAAVRQALGPGRPAVDLVLHSFLVGVALLVAAQVIAVGSDQRLLEASAFDGTDLLTIDQARAAFGRATDQLENAGYLLIAVGVATSATVARRRRALGAPWVLTGALLAAGILTVVVTQFVEAWEVYDVALVVSGAILLPLWAAGFARLAAAAQRGV